MSVFCPGLLVSAQFTVQMSVSVSHYIVARLVHLTKHISHPCETDPVKQKSTFLTCAEVHLQVHVGSVQNI